MHTSSDNPTAPPRRRPAVTVFECVASLTMLSATLGLTAQMVTRLDRAAQVEHQARLASATLENLMERAASSDWDSIRSDALQADLAGHVADAGLPGAGLAVSVQAGERTDAEKRVRLTLEWTPTPGAAPRRLSLTAFLFAQPRSTE